MYRVVTAETIHQLQQPCIGIVKAYHSTSRSHVLITQLGYHRRWSLLVATLLHLARAGRSRGSWSVVLMADKEKAKAVGCCGACLSAV